MSQDQTQRAARLAAKRAAVLQPRRSARKFILPVLGAVLLLGSAAALVARILPDQEAQPKSGAMFGYVAQEGQVAHPLTDLEGAHARFYQHKAGDGVIVRYFLHRGPDDTVLAALDACAECWREGKGHRQEGEAMVCVQCEKRFPLEELAERSDPCAPIGLPVTVNGQEVALAIPDLLEAAKYFKKPYGRL